MESVTMKSENEKLERIVLEPLAVSVIKEISNQLNLELGELVQVTQKAVANFIIRKRSQSLSTDEMSIFLSENYDLVRALKHATQKAITAKHNGDEIEISRLLKFIQTPGVNSEKKSVKLHPNKNNQKGAPKPSLKKSYNQDGIDNSELAIKEDIKSEKIEPKCDDLQASKTAFSS